MSRCLTSVSHEADMRQMLDRLENLPLLYSEYAIRTMARHILFTSQKGGVGKSTLARSTAVALACAGRKVLLADFDVEQGTCLRWQAQRQARRLEPAIHVAKFAKEKKLDRVSARVRRCRDGYARAA